MAHGFRASRFDRRKVLVIGATAVLAGCQIIPRAPAPLPAPAPAPSPAPSTGGTPLPQDEGRHRIALLVPMSGKNADVGQSIANSTTMALLDANASNLRITTYDTATNAGSAAARALSDGNTLILGPLMASNVPAVLAQARPAGVPLISFSNDLTAASRESFVMGHIPDQSIDRSVAFARSKGATNFAALIPDGEYGDRAEIAFRAAVTRSGGTLVAIEDYDRGNTSIVSAAQRLRDRGGIDTVLIPESSRLVARAAPVLKPAGADSPRIMGTELWSGEGALATVPALRGAWFSAVTEANYKRFADSYRSRFGRQPYRIATLGYDSVLLTLNIARKGWRPGRPFPTAQLYDKGGYLGLDGPFRFTQGGVVQRAMEVRQVGNGTTTTVSPAPTRFED